MVRFSLLLVLATCGWATSQSALPGNELPQVTLRLDEALVMALENNLELKVDRIAPQRARFEQLAASAIFEPQLRFSARYEEQSQTRLDFDDPFQQRNDTRTSVRSDAAIEGLLPFGMRWDLGVESREDRGSNQAPFQGSMGFNLTMPLWRDFGPANTLRDIRIARLGVEAADANFLTNLNDLVVRVHRAYYDLIFAKEDLRLQKANLSLAQQLQDDNEERRRVGVMSSLDVSRARSEAASRLEEVIRAEQAVRDAGNDLKSLLYRDIAVVLDQTVIPESLPLPPSVAVIPRWTERGLLGRPELVASQQRQRQAEQRLAGSRNQQRPEVELQGSYRLVGEGDSFQEGFRAARGSDDASWSTGVVVRIPLGGRAESARASQARLDLQAAELDFLQVRQTILLEWEERRGAVLVGEKRYAAAQDAARFARETLDAEVERLNAGTSTTFVVAQLQRDLVSAELAGLRALSDWRVAWIELLRSQNVLLQEMGIRTDL